MDSFKTQFNRDFSLSYGGKFIGLDTLPNRALFEHKFKKIVTLRLHDRKRKPLGDVIVFRCSGKTVKLYYR